MSQIEDPKTRPLTLDVKQVAQLLSVSRRTVYRLLDAGQIPKPMKLGSATHRTVRRSGFNPGLSES
jgi:excisionase family DNA binding protein